MRKLILFLVILFFQRCSFFFCERQIPHDVTACFLCSLFSHYLHATSATIHYLLSEHLNIKDHGDKYICLKAEGLSYCCFYESDCLSDVDASQLEERTKKRNKNVHPSGSEIRRCQVQKEDFHHQNKHALTINNLMIIRLHCLCILHCEFTICINLTISSTHTLGYSRRMIGCMDLLVSL